MSTRNTRYIINSLSVVRINSSLLLEVFSVNVVAHKPTRKNTVQVKIHVETPVGVGTNIFLCI